MDSVRYYVALIVVISVPGALLFWFSIHPFVQFWRRFRPWVTLAVHYTLIALLAALLFLIRKPLLSVEFGTDPVLTGLSIPLFVVTVILRKHFSKHLKWRILTGIPELASSSDKRALLTEGIYARIRHPRYVQVLVAFLAYALFCNYLATYIVFAAAVCWVLVVVPIEEKELRDRFGAEYEAYCAQVPRFIPKF